MNTFWLYQEKSRFCYVDCVWNNMRSNIRQLYIYIYILDIWFLSDKQYLSELLMEEPGCGRRGCRLWMSSIACTPTQRHMCWVLSRHHELEWFPEWLTEIGLKGFGSSWAVVGGGQKWADLTSVLTPDPWPLPTGVRETRLRSLGQQGEIVLCL